jgi:hypothetical protein
MISMGLSVQCTIDICLVERVDIIIYSTWAGQCGVRCIYNMRRYVCAWLISANKQAEVYHIYVLYQ